MAVKLVLLALLVAKVSCGQNSLTFVIDDTSSMYDEIDQVKKAAKSIVDIVLGEESSQIQDIVLVTFNDPAIAFKKKTRNEGELKRALDSIHVHGGGDCWEMSLSGIKKGLEESRPGSYVYVFTDASAKDYRKFEEIKTLCQEKQSQIVFILTGDCNDISQETYKVYHKIVAASNGQVFRIRKDEVGQVLEYVKETIKGDRTVIESTIVPPRTWSYVNFNIDEQTEYAIVSASGSSVELHVYDPRSYEIFGNHITWTKNVKVTKLANLSPGTYRARVKGNSEVNIMVFGRTDFTFQHGFSTTVQTNLKATDTQPTTGVETLLMVSVQDKGHSAVIHEVELLDMHDNVLKRLPLTQVQGDIYKTEKFLSPEDTFKIAVVATSKSTNRPVKRIAKTPVTPIQSVAPGIAKTEKVLKVKEGAATNVHCRIIQGKPRPQISWFVKKEGAAQFTPLKGTDEVYHVEKALTNDKYKCVATNVKSKDEHIVTLDVQSSPKFRDSPHTVIIKEGEPATIECNLQKGNPRPRMVWQFKFEDAAEYTMMSHDGEVWHIPAAKLNQAGEYRCLAMNSEGRDEKTTTLVVKGKPTIDKLPQKRTVLENTTLSIQCRVTRGFPKPSVTWFHKGSHSSEYKAVSKNEILTLKNIQLSDAGLYKCVAENEVDKTEQVVELVVNARPKFQDSPKTVIVKEGEPATIECKLQKGNPRPRVTWQFKLKDTAEYTMLSHDGEVWHIPAAKLTQAGEYRCLAMNNEGRDEKTTTLVVKGKPVIDKLPPKWSKMENTTLNIQCSVTRGFPKPSATWFYKGPHSPEYKAVSKNEILTLKNIQMSDAGLYKCVAENEVDKTEQTVELLVNSPPRIVFVPPNTPDYSGVEGDVAMRLSCSAVGYPTPAITWVVDKKAVGSDKSKELYVENSALFLINPKEHHSSGKKTHTYICHAKNEFGEATQSYDVYISKYADSDNANGTHYGHLDRPYDFPCPLPHTDPNSVRWFKNITYYKTGPSLHFDHPTHANSGNYTCRVSDLTGAASYTVEIIFGTPPKRDQSTFNFNWNGEETKKIACYSEESPVGKYDWSYNGKKIEGVHTQSLLPIGWGHYVCQITHPLGNLAINFQVTTKDKECGIPTSFLKTEHTPLILDSNQEWPIMPIKSQYLFMPHSEKLQLICQDEKSSTKSSKASNSFNKYPKSKVIYATCDKEDTFLVDGVSQKISELDCKDSVTPSVVRTGKTCLGDKTELIKVGFHINGFINVYQSCVDTVKNVPLYTKVNTLALNKEASVTKTIKSVCVDDCCNEKLQLVNAIDVSFGPAEKATYIDSLNSVNYCKPRNDTYTNWFDIEKMTREMAKEEQLTVWSGAVNYSKIGGTWTPKYLWKVIRSWDTSEKRVIIHENTGTAAKLCAGACGKDLVWFEPSGARTYCCTLDDFKKALGVDIDFNEG